MVLGVLVGAVGRTTVPGVVPGAEVEFENTGGAVKLEVSLVEVSEEMLDEVLDVVLVEVVLVVLPIVEGGKVVVEGTEDELDELVVSGEVVDVVIGAKLGVPGVIPLVVTVLPVVTVTTASPPVVDEVVTGGVPVHKLSHIAKAGTR